MVVGVGCFYGTGLILVVLSHRFHCNAKSIPFISHCTNKIIVNKVTYAQRIFNLTKPNNDLKDLVTDA